jgi:hypothetical protein
MAADVGLDWTFVFLGLVIGGVIGAASAIAWSKGPEKIAPRGLQLQYECLIL